MARTIAIVGLVLVLVLCAGGVMLYLAYGVAQGPPSSVRAAGLTDTASVTTYTNGASSIRAASREDAASALGYLHAQEHSWTMALWRRTAAGRLSEWFGEELLPLDRMTRRLGLGQISQRAYASLADEERSVLDAYARGVNAAIRDENARLSNEFVVLETVPERWEPWHSLAVERLFAWLAADRPDADSLEHAPRAMQEFFEADDQLRKWLHLHGFEHSLAWTLQDSAGTVFVQRHVYGSSALPVFHEVEIEWPDAAPRAGATLIGTPFMPAGKSDAQAWAVLLSSTIQLRRAVRDTAGTQPVYDRMQSADGREYLIRVQRTGEDIFFVAQRPSMPIDTTTTDTTTDTTAIGDSLRAASALGPAAAAPPIDSVSAAGWVLGWSGFRPISDAPAWHALAEGEAAAFQLFEGDGLILSRDGAPRVLGSPEASVTFDGGLAVGNTSWSRYAALRLDSLTAASDLPVGTAEAVNDRVSPWAAELAPPLTDAAIAVPDQPVLVTEALTYLRNWDFAYDRASIGASIFETWMEVYRDSLHRLPEGVPPDSSLGETLVRYEALVRGVERLASRYGRDPSQWRWEEVEPHTYYFPVWSADSLISDEVESRPRTRYRPVELPGAGHPTTLFYGPSPLGSEIDAPAMWESWVSTASWDTYRFRTRRFPANRFFGRYLVSDRTPVPAELPDRDRVRYAVVLIPE